MRIGTFKHDETLLLTTWGAQVLNGKFCKEFSQIEEDLEKEGDANPLNVLYQKSEASELGQAEKRVRARLAGLL